MPSIVDIESTESQAKIVFSNFEKYHFSIRFSSPTVSFGKIIHDFDAREDIVDFFNFIAKHWSVWNEELSWRSHDCGSYLTASIYEKNKIKLTINLSDLDSDETWDSTATIIFSVTKADKYARDISKFFER